MKTKGIDVDDAPDPDELQGRFALNGMCILMLPEPLFKELSAKAFARGQTLAQFLAAAVAAYNGDDAPPLPGPGTPGHPSSNFEFHDVPTSNMLEQDVPKKRARLKGFR